MKLVGQTAAKDKHGNELFVGDIILWLTDMKFKLVFAYGEIISIGDDVVEISWTADAGGSRQDAPSMCKWSSAYSRSVVSDKFTKEDSPEGMIVLLVR